MRALLRHDEGFAGGEGRSRPCRTRADVAPGRSGTAFLASAPRHSGARNTALLHCCSVQSPAGSSPQPSLHSRTQAGLVTSRHARQSRTAPREHLNEDLCQLQPQGPDPHVACERLGTYVSGRTRSVYFQCNEVLVSELFDTLANDAQRLALTELQNAGHHDVRWATSDEIRSRGSCRG